MEEAIKKKNEMLASGADKLDRVYELARIMDGMEFTDLVSANKFLKFASSSLYGLVLWRYDMRKESKEVPTDEASM